MISPLYYEYQPLKSGLTKKQGEHVMSNYLGYSGDNTDVVKRKQKLAKILQITSYLLIWTMGLLLFWLFTSGSICSQNMRPFALRKIIIRTL